MADNRESLDFDFFDTPRSPEDSDRSRKNKSNNQSSKTKSLNLAAHNPPSQSGKGRLSVSDLSITDQNSVKSDRIRRDSDHSSVSSLCSSDDSRSTRSSISKSSRSPSPSNSSTDIQKYSDSESETDNEKSYESDDNERNVSRKSKNKSLHFEAKSTGESIEVVSKSNKQAWGEPRQSKPSKSSSISKDKSTILKGKSGFSYKEKLKNESPQSNSDELSDSDMTDVSPIESPRPNISRNGGVPKFSPMTAPEPHFDDEELDYSEKSRKNALDLEILMKAVGELEKQKRLKANSRRVMFAPMTLKKSHKSNYTFDKDQTRDIERENQRLLKEIVQQVHASEKKKQNYRSSPASTYKLTASAINRDKEMRRIENENKVSVFLFYR